MDRKTFIQICSGGCLGVLGINLSACSPTRHIQSNVSNNQIPLRKDEFKTVKGEKISYRKTIITKAEGIDYPIAVYRFSETEYQALLMRCTHQGNELSMNGDILSCSAHGSEFTNKGEVIQGPAEQKLRSFRISTDENHLYIHLA